MTKKIDTVTPTTPTPQRVTIEAEPAPLEIDLQRTCVVIVDMQNGFIARGALLDTMGFDIEPFWAPVEPIKKISKAARARRCRVIHIVTVHHPGDAGTGPDSVYWHKEGSLVLYRNQPELKDRLLLPGTWGTEIIPELALEEGDVAVEKPRYSGFFNTNLDTILKRFNIKYLITTGEATNNCVEAMVRDAYYHGYFAIVVSDATAAAGPSFMQEAALFNMTRFYGWVTTTENVLKALAQA